MEEQKKKCSKCGEVKLLSEFGKDSSMKSGIHSQCKECKRKALAERRKNGTKIKITIQEKECICCGMLKQKEEFKEKKEFRDGRDSVCSGCKKIPRKERTKIIKNRKDLLFKKKMESQEKECPRCCKIKPFSEYAKNKSTKDGLQSECKDCSKKHREKEESKLKIIEQKRRYRDTKNGRAKVRFDYHKRRALEKRAIPYNISKNEELEIKLIIESLKESEQLDHIAPIQGELPDGKRILGAHIPKNLQKLNFRENASKCNKITYEELSSLKEGVNYIFVPDDYHEDPSKYPSIGFDIEGGTTAWKQI